MDIDLKDLIVLLKDLAWSGRFSAEFDKAGISIHPNDFYSPIPNVEDLVNRRVQDEKSDHLGIDMRDAAQIELIRSCSERFKEECHWPKHKLPGKFQYFSGNPSFASACATSTHYMMRHFKPKRVIEVGSGMSSFVIAQALDRNNNDSKYSVIDPYPLEHISELPKQVEVIKERVECLNPTFFDSLEANDILFVDSGHVVKTGADVNYIFLKILPRLKPGVVVHFHDIPFPYEYGEGYFASNARRMYWSESYLLEAFLSFNYSYKVLLGMYYMNRNHSEEYLKAFPYLAKDEPSSGSFWIQRII